MSDDFAFRAGVWQRSQNMHMGVELGKEVGSMSLRQDGSSQRTDGADMIDVVMVPDVHIRALLFVGYLVTLPFTVMLRGLGCFEDGLAISVGELQPMRDVDIQPLSQAKSSRNVLLCKMLVGPRKSNVIQPRLTVRTSTRNQ